MNHNQDQNPPNFGGNGSENKRPRNQSVSGYDYPTRSGPNDVPMMPPNQFSQSFGNFGGYAGTVHPQALIAPQNQGFNFNPNIPQNRFQNFQGPPVASGGAPSGQGAYGGNPPPVRINPNYKGKPENYRPGFVKNPRSVTPPRYQSPPQQTQPFQHPMPQAQQMHQPVRPVIATQRVSQLKPPTVVPQCQYKAKLEEAKKWAKYDVTEILKLLGLPTTGEWLVYLEPFAVYMAQKLLIIAEKALKLSKRKLEMQESTSSMTEEEFEAALKQANMGQSRRQKDEANQSTEDK